jgi:Flp pilus assembly protein TadD
LLTYPDAKKRATQIREVTKSRYMPPWLPEPGKGDFIGSRRLSDAQIATIEKWVEGGAPEGSARDLPPRPRFTEGWQLGPPDLVVTLDRPYTLTASGPDVFRNFVLRVPVNQRRYVRAMEVRPGNPRVVHHANVLPDRTGSARLREGRDGAPGFGGMDLELETRGFEPETHFLFWKPGTVYTEEPDGMSWILDPGTDLVLNMHLQPSGKPELLQPSIGLYFTGKAPTKRPMLIQLENDGALDIPAGRRDFVIADHLKLPVDLDVLGVYPHAHYIGKDLQAWAALPDGSRRWLIHIPDWDINWQAVYRYREPVFLPKGTVISMRYVYDNSAENPRNPSDPPQRVVNGDRSIDEMGHLWLQVLPRGDGGGTDPRMMLQEAVMRRRLEKYPNDFLAHYTLAAMSDAAGKHDEAAALFREALASRPGDAAAHNALGAVLAASGKLDEAIGEFEAAAASRPDYPDAQFNLGHSFLAQGRYAEAVPHLRKVLEVNPGDAAALSHLGAALYAMGDAAEAAGYLRRAVEEKPDYFDARHNLGQALAATGDLDGAIAEFHAAIAIQPSDPDAHAALGVVLARKGDFGGAEREFTEATRLDPSNEDARRNLAAVRRRLGK